MNTKQIALVVLDGWGYREEPDHNAIASAKTPNFDALWAKYPHSLLKASGSAVGLPEGQMGNSEVGHMTIGCGKPADTDLVRIDKAIVSGDFDANPVINSLFEHAKKNNSAVHAMGLVSTGGVHSHQSHLFAFLRLAKKRFDGKVAIHIFTDGRDTPPQSAAGYVRELEKIIAELGPNFFISTISGRYYAMDRDNNWDRLAKVEQAIFESKGEICDAKASEYLDAQYKNGKNDELLVPAVCKNVIGLGFPIKANDAVFFFNFRADRARMLSEKMIAKSAKENLLFVTMTEYNVKFTSPIVFPPFSVETTIGQEVAQAGLSQARIAETEKFAHATYFLNGGQEKRYKNETDILIPSRKDIKTHDEAPEMQADAIADAAVKEIENGINFIFVNFANADMVGHTANVPAIIKAVEAADTALGKIVSAIEKSGGIALITADHGNAEINVDPETGVKHTAHTTSPVPFIATSKEVRTHDGALYDLAPTALHLLGIKIPSAMTGSNLIERS